MIYNIALITLKKVEDGAKYAAREIQRTLFLLNYGWGNGGDAAGRFLEAGYYYAKGRSFDKPTKVMGVIRYSDFGSEEHFNKQDGVELNQEQLTYLMLRIKNPLTYKEDWEKIQKNDLVDANHRRLHDSNKHQSYLLLGDVLFYFSDLFKTWRLSTLDDLSKLTKYKRHSPTTPFENTW